MKANYENVEKSNNFVTLSALNNEKPCQKATYEDAIGATGLGKFNIFMVVICLAILWAVTFEMKAIAYIIPMAQCDLNLSLWDKGLLSAICFAGMFSTGFVWGLLSDAFGRRKLICTLLLLDGIIVLISACSQNATFLVIIKFLGGAIICGPSSAILTYMAEIHASNYRARGAAIIGAINTTGTMVLPLLAWIMNLDIDFSIYNWKFHSWNIFLVICSLPAFIAGTCFLFLPETPKYLMSNGKHDEALEIFRWIYSLNSGKAPETYPITDLIIEKTTESEIITKTPKEILGNWWQQVKPLFCCPFLFYIILICFMDFLINVTYRTFVLWLPQMLQAIVNYEMVNNETASFCIMLETLNDNVGNVTNVMKECVVNKNNAFVYTNSFIISIVGVAFYLCTAILVNWTGKKPLIGSTLVLTAACVGGLYFSNDNILTVALSALILSFPALAGAILFIVVLDYFPTSFRNLTMALTEASGRMGSLFGNLIFPLLLALGCGPTFLTLSLATIFAALLVFLLPYTDLKPLP